MMPPDNKYLMRIISLVLIFLLCTNLSFALDIKAPDFVLNNIKGEKVFLSSSEGKYVVLFFWATWCPYCILEMKSMQRRCPDFKENDLDILAINVGESKYRIDKFLSRSTFCFNFLLDKFHITAYKYGLIGLPAVFIIDRKGFIRYQGSNLPYNLTEYIKDE